MIVSHHVVETMGVGGALRQVAAFLEECEQATAVKDVDLVECNEGSDGLSADVELSLGRPAPDGDAMTLCTTSLTTDGSLRVGFETAEAVCPITDHDIDVEPQGGTLTADGTFRIEMTAFVADEPSATGESSTAANRRSEPRADEGNDRDVPPFKDPELLASVYESCETFAEMAETLDMDVTAETVRRYMIDYDIHEPNSYNTAEDRDDATSEDTDGVAADTGATDVSTGGGETEDPTAASEEPVVLSDGIGLPENITAEELISTVEGSNTIYEVKRDMGVDRQDALEMLRELNLLDLVVGRLATEAERNITREDIVERLRETSEARTAG